jgi:phage N-6-adenine-methyltransferase
VNDQPPRLQQKSFEWYTPAKYVNAVRRVLGTIDLDPASSKIANQTVQATRYYDQESDGLKQSWHGNVYHNPPYCKQGAISNQEIWTCKLIAEYNIGNVKQAILLVNAATETGWFQRLYAFPICFVKGRIHFNNPTGIVTGPTVGSAFVYFGLNIELFDQVFSAFGKVILPRSEAQSTLWNTEGGAA